VTGLDLDKDEDFSVCMENEDSNNVNCESAKLYDEDEAVYIDIRVPA
jgi:hypothetical protein